MRTTLGPLREGARLVAPAARRSRTEAMTEQPLSLAEILTALSHALDLTEGQTDGHTVRSCLIGMRLAEAIGLDDRRRADLYYALLLKDAGCSANAAPVARLFESDDHDVKRDLKTTDWSRPFHAARYGIRNVAAGGSLLRRLLGAARLGLAGTDAARGLVRMRCGRGAEIIRSLGFPEESARAVYSLDEHWDGCGHPDGLRGEAIPLLARVASVAQTTEAFATTRGRAGAIDMLTARRGSWFEPRLVDAVLEWSGDDAWWDLVASPAARDAVLEAEPNDSVRPADQRALNRVAEAFAGIIDAKSPYTSSHSRGVARYAVAIAEELGLGPRPRLDLYRAGLLHDIGKLGVSSRILDKPGPLTADERAAVRRHPAYGWEILRPVRAFESFSWPAVLHHERLDGKGYPWRLGGDDLGIPARVLAVADVFEALTARRPYREPLQATAALAVVERGRGTAFDPNVVDALSAVVLTDAEAVLGAA